MVSDNRLNDTENGFAIVVVLIGLAILAAIAATFSASVTTDTRVAANIVQELKAQNLADAGVRLAALGLDRHRARQAARLIPHRSPFQCRFPGSRDVLDLVASNTGGRVDLNTASHVLLASVLAGATNSKFTGEQLADRIADFRDNDRDKRRYGAEDEEYFQARLPYGPKNAPFDSIEEFGQVVGVTTEIYLKLKPFITVHSRLSGIDRKHASPRLIQVIQAGLRLIGEDWAEANGLPLALQSPSQQRSYLIRATVLMSDGLNFTREAVVEFPARSPRLFKFHRWMQIYPEPTPAPLVTAAEIQTLPEC